jgi:hypothetical protein
VPKIDDLSRQLAQRFGLSTMNWEIVLIDAIKPQGDPDQVRRVGQFAVETMAGTVIRFDQERRTNGGSTDPPSYRAFNADGSIRTDIEAGFTHDGRFLPVTGWVAYAREPYKDDLMAGVRIYCRGKIASQTSVFNRGAGFTGEYDVRSYFVGEIHADWLDEEDDLIQTDRRDILWSHELGQALEKWGQQLVRLIGKETRNPLRQKAWDRFQEASGVQ